MRKILIACLALSAVRCTYATTTPDGAGPSTPVYAGAPAAIQIGGGGNPRGPHLGFDQTNPNAGIK